MRYATILFVLIMGLLSTNNGICASQTGTVVVTAMGQTENDAVVNASRMAVQQIVGMYVVSDTHVLNMKLIKDEILTYSNGYVETFKVLEKRPLGSGMVEIDAQVEVKIERVKNKLVGMKLATKKFDLNKKQFLAKTVSKQKKIADFAELAEKVIFKPLLKSPYKVEITQIERVDSIVNNKRLDGWGLRYYFHNKSKYGSTYFSPIDDNFDERDRFPVKISFNISLDDGFVENVKYLLQKSCKKKLTFNKKGQNIIYFINHIDLIKSGGLDRDSIAFRSGYQMSQRQTRKLKAIYDRYYGDDKLLGEQALNFRLADINDVNIGNVFFAKGYNVTGGDFYFTSEGSDSPFTSNIDSSQLLYRCDDSSCGVNNDEIPYYGQVGADFIKGITYKTKYDDHNFYFINNRASFNIIIFLTKDQIMQLESVSLQVINDHEG